MNETYRNASQVVVLDAWLQSTAAGRIGNIHELSMRVAVCEWNSRLWTLPEAAFSKTLRFAFRDTLFQYNAHLIEDARHLRLCSDWAVREAAATSMLRVKGTPWLQKSSGLLDLDGELMRWTINAMCRRLTSKLSDEAVCAANLLDLEVLEIVKITGQTEAEQQEKRMLKLWRILDKIPYMFLFIPHPVPRLREKGFRWAPSTLRGGHIIERPPLHKWNSAMASIYQRDRKRGLFFQSSGLLLHCPVQPLHERLSIRDEWGQWHLLLRNILTDNSPVTLHADPVRVAKGPNSGLLYPWLPEDANRTGGEVAESLPVCLALITIFPIKDRATTKKLFDQDNPSILVAVEEITDIEIFARGYCHAMLRVVADQTNVAVFEARLQASEKLEREHGVPFGFDGTAISVIKDTRALPESQAWVLD